MVPLRTERRYSDFRIQDDTISISQFDSYLNSLNLRIDHTATRCDELNQLGSEDASMIEQNPFILVVLLLSS